MPDVQLLDHIVNRFNGVEVAEDRLPADAVEFRRRLGASLDVWRREGRAVVWLDVPIDKAALIPAATDAGFTFHHAADINLSLVCRLNPDALVPSFATHFIGAGAVVLNERQELLVVNELHRRDRSRPYYKLPGGALQPGEHLVNAVIREVFEETGVRAKFEALVCFRHWHGYRWNKSDIYFICRLSPLTRQITIQPNEIEESRWMPVDEYLASEYVGIFNKRVVMAALESPGVAPTEIEGYGDPLSYEIFMPARRNGDLNAQPRSE